MTHRSLYIARINRVIDHIDAHLAEPLDLEALAAVAHFSPFHFHRIFHAMTGETLAERVRRRRLEVAAARLLASPPTPALEVALEVGFGSGAAFTRAFSGHFGVSPSGWRRGAWRAWAERHQLQLSKIHQADRNASQAVMAAFREDRASWPAGHVELTGTTMMDVEIKTLANIHVAYLRHVGPYGTSGIPRTWQRLAAWCEQRGLTPPRRTMYGISYDNPDFTPPEKCRYDACVEVEPGFKPDGEIGVQTLAGGRYACTEFTGTPETIHAGWMRLCGEWLPDSGYQADDRPSLEIYGRDFEMDEKTGAFSCQLCFPVKAL